MDIDTSKYSLYVCISDSSYIDKIKSSINLIKSYSEVTIGFLKEKNDSGEYQNVIEFNTTGSLEGSIGIYIKHILSADERNFKTYNSITKTNENLINVKLDIISEIFKAMQSTSILTMYMLNTPDKLYINDQEGNTNTICNYTIQTMEKKDNVQLPKYYNLRKDIVKAVVRMDSEVLSNIIKKRFNKSIKSESSIGIKLTRNAISFISRPMRTASSMSNLMEITCIQSDNLTIDIKDPEIEIIESNYVYQNLDFLKSIKPQYYKQVVLMFAKLKSTGDDNYVIQFCYSGSGDKLTDDIIKITVYPCILDRNDNFDNNNQIVYNN